MTTSSKVAVVRLCDVLPLLDADRHIGKREAAAFLGMSVRKIEGLLADIPHFRVGGQVLFRKSELIAWMNRHREHTSAADLARLADDVIREVLGRKKNSQLDGHRTETNQLQARRRRRGCGGGAK